LVGDNRPLSAESSVNVSCRVTGAKPPPIITWWKDATQMTDAKQIVSYPKIYILIIGFCEQTKLVQFFKKIIKISLTIYK